MTEMNIFPRQIWMYWENRRGSVKPAYLDMCLETVERHRGDFELTVLDDKSVRDYIEVPDKVARFEQIAHRADYIRFQLLKKYGGIWLDADVILLRDIGDAVFPYINQYDFVGYGREPGKPSINFIACRRGCSLIHQHVKVMDQVLETKQPSGFLRKKIKLVWTEIGHDILWRLAKDYPYYHHELSRMAPIFWRDWEVFFRSDLALDHCLKSTTLMVMLYNDFMHQKLTNMSRQELWEGDLLLSKLLRHSLTA